MPNRHLPVLYAAVNEEMKVEYTSDDRDSADAYAFACKLKVFVYPPPTQTREVWRLLAIGEPKRVGDKCLRLTSGEWYDVHPSEYGEPAVHGLFMRRETIPQGPARCGTCPFCNRDAADEEGRSYCLLNVRLVRANEYCSMHPQNQEREGRG